MIQFSPIINNHISKSYRLKCLCRFVKKTICQVPHVSLEEVCQCYQDCPCSSINTTFIWYSSGCPIQLKQGNYCLEMVLFSNIFHKEAVCVSFISFMAFSPCFQKAEACSVFSHTQSRLITDLSMSNLPSRKSNQLYWKVDCGVLSSVKVASKILPTTGYIGVIKTINLLIDL